MSDANSTQVGGDHYKGRIEPWDYIVWNEIGFLEGSAIKYVTRARRKNGAEDLEKAKHFLQKLYECANTSNAGTRRAANKALPMTGLRIKLDAYAKSNELTPSEKDIVRIATSWKQKADLLAAIQTLDILIAGGNPSGVIMDSQAGHMVIVEEDDDPTPRRKAKVRKDKTPEE